ncbi:ATP-binding Cassette (ABC) Superfamily [Thraustotheca clavata]|uniref:ATP-binding Cassette (ABC) Superfamily n=1 Tax=Thraustotheca clavata TaxID=74557 RepID=A0A1V9ZMA4_9STRA|nr:ATP-binding Cassette (ABC) Superfamily [Thraustotheca clavata]
MAEETTPYSSLHDARHPLETANYASIVTMGWLDSLIRRGAKKALNEEDVWTLSIADTSTAVHDRFQIQWQKELENSDPKLHMALWRTLRGKMILTVLLYIVSAGLNLVQPWVIKSIVEYLQQQGHSSVVTSMGISSGYGLAGLLAALSFVSITCADYAQFVATHMGCNAKTIFVDSVFLKTLRLSGIEKQQITSGEVVTMATVDSEKILHGFWLGFWSFVSPLMLLVIMILVGYELGYTVGLIGGGIMLIFMTAGYISGTKVGEVKRKLLKAQAERVKLMNEILQGIRVVKLYAWENNLEEYITQVRMREFEHIKTFQMMRVINTVTLFAAPLVTMTICWIAYIGMGNEMSSTKAFTVMALMNTALFPCTNFSNAVMYASDAFASCQRVNKFLLRDEIPSTAEKKVNTSPQLELIDSQFAWQTQPVLHDINLLITTQKPSLTIVVGAVASGKSSLIHALLGEMTLLSGQRIVFGNISYVSQEVWIQHDTLKNNILFASNCDAVKYQKVVAACQLLPDLAMLTHGDDTEIGERGINLSGGQKARVSLARALYRSDADIYLLDDPLSALDVHVAGSVFADCIKGLLKHKTTILVLNSHYHLLPQADRIIVMDGGRIVGDGTFESVRAQFPHLVSTQLSDENSAIEVVKKENNEEPKEKQKSNDDGKLVMQEERATGSVSVKTYTDYFGSSGWNGAFVATTVGLSYLLCQGCLVGGDIFLSRWSTNAELKSSITTALNYGAIILAAVILVWVRSMYALYIAQWCSINLHKRLFHKVLSLPVPTFFDVTPVGRILNRFSSDLDMLDSQIPFYGYMVLQFLFQVLAVLFVCGITTPYVIIVYPFMLGAFYLVQIYYNPTSGALKRMDSITRSPIVTLVAETLSGLTTVRAFDMNSVFVKLNRNRLDHHMRFFSTFYMTRAWFQMRLDWLSAAIVVVVAFLCIALRSSLGLVAAGLSLTYASQLSSFLSKGSMFYNMVDTMMTSVERLNYYDTLEGEDANQSVAEPPSNWPATPSIELNKVSMRYRPNLPLVLKDMSLTIEAQEKVGICGRTGSGKSSFMSALFRMVELESGSISIDGVDITSIPVLTLRSKLTIIPQDPVLFSGALRFNLDPSNEKDDLSLWQSLKRVHLAEYFETQGGLEFQVAEKGSNLSVGQRQLLCIARALLRDSKIVVLDEATANVDVESDRLIQAAIRECFSQVTLLVIAHRLETILHCDKILVLDQGILQEFDAPDKLLQNKDGMFSSLMQQAGLISTTQ